MRLLAATLSLLLAACASPPQDIPPIDAPAFFELQRILEKLGGPEELNTPPVAWWEGFEDPVLNDMVTATLLGNNHIRAAAARVRAQQARLRGVKAEDRLRLEGDVELNARDEQALGDSASTQTAGARAGIFAVLPLDLFGRNARREEAAMAALKVAQAEMRQQVLLTSADVVRNYVTLRGLQQRKALLEHGLSLQERIADLVRARHEAGLEGAAETNRAEAQVARTRATLPPLDEEIRTTAHRLMTLQGAYPALAPVLVSSSHHADIPVYRAAVPLAVPIDVLRRRPDVQAAEARLRRAFADIGVAEAAYLPVFELTGGIALSSTGLDGGAFSHILATSVGAALQATLLDGRRKSATEEATALAEEAAAHYKDAVLAAAADVEAVLAALEAAQLQQEAIDLNVQASTAAARQTEALFREGLASLLELITAQQAQIDSEQALAQSRIDFAVAMASLFAALGSPVDAPTGL